MKFTLEEKWLPGFIALGLTWGSSFFLMEIALGSFSPYGIALFRGLSGGVSLLVFSLLTRQSFVVDRRTLLDLAVVALLLNSIPGFLFSYGQTYVSSVVAGMLNATTPLMTVLVIMVAFREQRLNANQLLGVAIGFLGITCVSGVLQDSGSFTWQGIGAILLATLCYGISFPFSRRRLGNVAVSSTMLATYQVLMSGLLLLPISLMTPVTNAPLQQSAIIAMALLGAIGTGFAYIWNFRNVRLAGSAIASTVTYMTPVVATILGVFILGEPLGVAQIVGGVLVVASALLVQERVRVVGNRADEDVVTSEP